MASPILKFIFIRRIIMWDLNSTAIQLLPDFLIIVLRRQ